MNELLRLFTLSMAQAHLVYLVVNSSLSLKLQARFRLPNLLKELLACPVCTGFWGALVLALGHPVQTLVIGFVGSVLYEAKQKFLPCQECQNKVNASEWKIS